MVGWDREKGEGGGRQGQGPGRLCGRTLPLGVQALLMAPLPAAPPPTTPRPITGDCTHFRCQGEGGSPQLHSGSAGVCLSGWVPRGCQTLPFPVPKSPASGCGVGQGAHQCDQRGPARRSQGKGHVSLRVGWAPTAWAATENSKADGELRVQARGGALHLSTERTFQNPRLAQRPCLPQKTEPLVSTKDLLQENLVTELDHSLPPYTIQRKYV